ncbi:MAG: hypothetical protein JWO25_68 [Alphaproteobacteria bacterium]|nr:hypothetical protein [Alphaproteobacteria bacterium]
MPAAAINASIAGLGKAGITREPTPPARELARLAVLDALADAGLTRQALDGLLICRTSAATDKDLGLDLQRTLGLRDLALLEIVLCEGASAIAAIQQAALAVSAGLATTVACVFADAPLVPGKRTSESFGRIKSPSGIDGLRYSAGLFGGAAIYALAARRYLDHYGANEEALSSVAVAARQWAMFNPDAIFRQPLTRDQYFAARYIAEPLRLFDCAIPVNGGIAVIITSRERAADLRQPPAHILSMAQGHPGTPDARGFERELSTGGRIAAPALLARAGISVDEVDLLQLYDAFSISTLLSLEQYGICGPGEAIDFVADGGIAPGGRIPVNTGGGHLSGYYLQGMTPVAEAVIQARGAGGDRQCGKARTILVTNEGGRFDYHAALLLGQAEHWS